MSIAGLKSLLFPPRGADRSPLLPAAQCPRKDCPCQCRTPPPPPELTAPDSTATHKFAPRTVSDAIIGLSDGLTVPFALTAGLSAFNDTRVVLFGGMAELIAGSISMGLGGWLAGRGEADFHHRQRLDTERAILHDPDQIRELIAHHFQTYSVPPPASAALVETLLATPADAVDFVLRFCHGITDDGRRTPLRSALTIAAGYFIGGFIPLLPYFFVGRREVMTGLWWSVGVMAGCLFVFGVLRGVLTGEKRGAVALVGGGVEMMMVGGVAAGASWGIVRALGSGEG